MDFTIKQGEIGIQAWYPSPQTSTYVIRKSKETTHSPYKNNNNRKKKLQLHSNTILHFL